MTFLSVFKKDDFSVPSHSQPLTEDCEHSTSLPIFSKKKKKKNYLTFYLLYMRGTHLETKE